MLCVRNPLMESSAGAVGAEEDAVGKSGRRRAQQKSSLSSGLSGQFPFTSWGHRVSQNSPNF